MKKNLEILFIIATISISCNHQEMVLVDLDGNNYHTQDYEGTLWMTENLKVQKDKNGNKVKFYYPDNAQDNVKIYGLLYYYETACKICPDGWELPTNKDWEKLFSGKSGNSANNFKDIKYWEEETNTNNSKFTVRPSGYGNNGEFDNFFKHKTYFWSKTDHAEHIWTFIFEKGNENFLKA